jgi:hypothetical protein
MVPRGLGFIAAGVDSIDELTLDECDFYGLTRPGTDDDYCDMSFLRKTQCACCLGHIIDTDLEEASKP